MARPKKYRKICHFPKVREFVPSNSGKKEKKRILLTLDEYETIRLIDREGKSQEECSTSMKVARTTIQMIYTSAREKIAEAIVEGCVLEIEGGEYDLCSGREDYCTKEDCYKKLLARKFRKSGEDYRVVMLMKDGKPARDSFSYDHFKIIDIRSEERDTAFKEKGWQEKEFMLIEKEEKLEASIEDFLYLLGTDLFLCETMEEDMGKAFRELGIEYHKI